MKPYGGTCEGRLLALPWGRRVGGGKWSCEEREVGELLSAGLLPLSHLLVSGSPRRATWASASWCVVKHGT